MSAVKAPKPAKAQAANKKRSLGKDNARNPVVKPKGPGVIASIGEFLSAASEKKPITKEQMVDLLAKRFPERERLSMSRTVSVQIPGRYAAENNVKIVKHDDGGFYIKK